MAKKKIDLYICNTARAGKEPACAICRYQEGYKRWTICAKNDKVFYKAYLAYTGRTDDPNYCRKKLKEYFSGGGIKNNDLGAEYI